MPETDNKRLLDLDAGLGRLRGNKGIFKKMLALFLASEEFSMFEAALDAGEYEKASDIAHAIKGMTGNLSMTALFEESAELMTQLKSGPPDEDTLLRYRTALDDTTKLVNSLMEEL